jgi:26S proteasome regulatory subunit N2
MTKLSSASGIVSLLDEEDHELKEVALKRMESLNIVDEYWAEISESLQKMYFSIFLKK